MNGGNYFIFHYSSSRRNSGIYIFKASQGDDEWNSKWQNKTEGKNPKKISSSVK